MSRSPSLCAAIAVLTAVAPVPAWAGAKVAVIEVSVTVADSCGAAAGASRSQTPQVTLACPEGIGWTAVAAKDGQNVAGWSQAGVGTGAQQAIMAPPSESLQTATGSAGSGDLVITISY